MKNKKTIVLGAVALVVLLGFIFLIVNKNVSNKNNTASDETVVVEETEEAIPANADGTAPVDKSVYMDPTVDVETRIQALMSQMTLEEKAAQMVQPEQASISLDQVRKFNVGSILSGGGSAPATGNTQEGWRTYINQLKQASLESRLGIPLLYGVDAVHGHNNVLGATVFPHNIGLGAADDEELMERIGAVVAKEVRATGIQWTFAPCLGNAQNELWGRTNECFSENAEVVARMGAAFTRGAQGKLGTDDYLTDSHILTNAKHYIGEGYTVNGTNQGNVVMDEADFEELLQSELLLPYKAQVDDGVMTVMVSYNSVNGLKCHEGAYLLNDVLKGQLGFTGLVVSDYNGVEQVSGGSFKNQIANSVNAGVDLLMEPNNWESTIINIVALVNEGGITQERLDDAVRRILRVKFMAGLFDEEIGSETELKLAEEFGSEEHREVAREAVRKSLVLLKNDEVNGQTAMEALKAAEHITVVGTKAFDIGSQCGGWTISWQGSTGKITLGTTIVNGIANKVGRDFDLVYNPNGVIEGDRDAIIVVIGENPYAETAGDRSASSLVISAADVAMMDKIKDTLADYRKKGTAVIGLLVTGRPVTIADYVDCFDAIVETWLPGTEGDGVADVLLGDYDFTGTLKFTWPWYASDIDKKFDDESLVLFKNGTGLRKDGSSINSFGTTVIGEKPAKSESELAALSSGSIDLESTGYVLEAENYTEDSYLIATGNANNITYVDSWNGEWANAKWKVFVPKAGNYKLHFYIAAAKDSKSVDLYYATPSIEDDGAANRTNVAMTATGDMLEYQDFTVDVKLDSANYEFKFMNGTAEGCDFRLDRIEFEYLD